VVSIASAISWVGAVAGIITGHVALTQIKRSGERGRGLAITGLVLGYLYVAGAIAFGVLGMLFRIRGYAVPDSFGNMGGHMGPGMMGGFDRDHNGPDMGFNR
jgi:peptidyl-prolyl cis-trans isomerase B (cyclophilin B)